VRLLFDENLSDRLVQRLADIYPGSVHVKHVGLRHTRDDVIWQYAIDNNYAIVSQDNDFREHAWRSGPPPKVILLRSGNSATRAIAVVLRNNLANLQAFEQGPDALLIIQ
jgi:predicted nuclease of predicted toxin-antitoxin system